MQLYRPVSSKIPVVLVFENVEIMPDVFNDPGYYKTIERKSSTERKLKCRSLMLKVLQN